MIVSDIVLPIGYTDDMLLSAIRQRIKHEKIRSVHLLRRSIDARKKPDVRYVVTAAVNEEDHRYDPVYYAETATGPLKDGETDPASLPLLQADPVLVVGSGPAGLFTALTLLRLRIPVLMIDRGDAIEQRTKAIRRYHETGILDPESNVQFGEGGAGTFSDGKLNTGIRRGPEHDEVLRTFCAFGAPEEIVYDAKPHIGTDRLRDVITSMRREIERLGGIVRFRSAFTGFRTDGNRNVNAAVINGREEIAVSAIVLAIGHSSRDTFETLKNLGIVMEPKPFAVGVRVEHPEELITKSQYGSVILELGAASYKLTMRAGDGRGVYSFCMCPGGFVIDASSEPGAIAVNGMSYHARNNRNSNAAIVVSVSPEDYYRDSPLDGVAFQRTIEKNAYLAGEGAVPAQRLGDFIKRVKTTEFGAVAPSVKGRVCASDLDQVLPGFINESLREAFPRFGRMIERFDMEDAVLSAPETRTSSPLRILRDNRCESSVPGLYPAGEGAGYAGGIVSSAVDGIRVAYAVFEKLTGYRP